MDFEIQKHDEVYSRVLCADRGYAAELSEYFTFQVPGYQFMPAYRMGAWDGKIRLYNVMTGMLYRGLNPYVEKFCKDRQYTYEYDVDPTLVEFSVREAEEWISKQNFPEKYEVRDYQVETLVHAVRYGRGLYECPTSSGKTFMIYMILRYYLQPALIIVPTETLIHQTYDEFKDMGFDSDKYVHKIYQGQDKKTSKPIVISTWQSIYKLPSKWFDKFNVVVGDEAHQFQSKSLMTLMEKTTTVPYRFGLTGTLKDAKTHKLVLEGLFGTHIRPTTTKELMDQGHVSDFRIKVCNLKHPESIRKNAARLTYQQEMDFLVTNDRRNRFIANLALSLKGNTLVLFQYVDKHGKPLYDLIKKISPDRKVYIIHGTVKGTVRNEIRALLEQEEDSIVIASYGTLSTGVSIKRLKNAIFASPSKSKIRNLQSIGRTLRKTEHYGEAILYDISDDLRWKTWTNYTYKHLIERIKIYDQEQFKYKVYNVELGNG